MPLLALQVAFWFWGARASRPPQLASRRLLCFGLSSRLLSAEFLPGVLQDFREMRRNPPPLFLIVARRGRKIIITHNRRVILRCGTGGFRRGGGREIIVIHNRRVILRGRGGDFWRGGGFLIDVSEMPAVIPLHQLLLHQ